MKRLIIFSFILGLIIPGCVNHTEPGYNAPDNGELDQTFIDQDSLAHTTAEQKIQQEREKLISEGWQEKKMLNGQLPVCYNYTPRKGEVDNSLEVTFGGGTDVAIKVMNLASEVCIRYVFINSGTSYSIRNIPEGKYYLKIAYGRNWLSKIENGQCTGKFLRDPMYEKGEDVMDFSIRHTQGGYSIPSYRLQLDVVSTDVTNSFDSHGISEDEFNR